MKFTETQKNILKQLVEKEQELSTDKEDFVSKESFEMYNTNLKLILKELRA